MSSTGPDDGPIQLRLLPDNASVRSDGRLQIGGVDVLELAIEFGTPLFVYDEGHIRARCREAVSAWGRRCVAYATKAFLCRAMARLVHEEGMTLDVSSAGEMHAAVSAGVPPDDLVFHGNNKSEAELALALELGVGRIVIDSFDEIDRLARLLEADPAKGSAQHGSGSRMRQRVLIRVTPGVEAHTHEFVRTGQEDSKFGFGLASGAAAEAVDRVSQVRRLELVGIHAHIGSQVFRAASFADEVEVLAGFFAQVTKVLDPDDRPGEICVGGGLGVPYVAAERAPSITEWAQTVHEAAAKAGIPESARISAEPGRSIVASSAITLYTVGTIKTLPGIRTYVAVDGGMSDNPRPVLYGSGYEVFLPRAVTGARSKAVTVVGKHCESGDVLVADGRLPEDLVVGDVLATPVTGAYGYSMASTYNKVPRPAVVFVSNGQARIVIRRETEADLVALDVG